MLKSVVTTVHDKELGNVLMMFEVEQECLGRDQSE